MFNRVITFVGLALFCALGLLGTFRRDLLVEAVHNKDILILAGILLFAALFIIAVGKVMKKKVEPPIEEYEDDEEEE